MIIYDVFAVMVARLSANNNPITFAATKTHSNNQVAKDQVAKTLYENISFLPTEIYCFLSSLSMKYVHVNCLRFVRINTNQLSLSTIKLLLVFSSDDISALPARNTTTIYANTQNKLKLSKQIATTRRTVDDLQFSFCASLKSRLKYGLSRDT